MPDTHEPCHPENYPIAIRIRVCLRSIRTWIRIHIHRYRFLTLGKGFSCGDGLFVFPHHVAVGDYVYMGRHAHLAGRITIGNYCLIASYVAFVGGDHPLDKIGYPMCFSGGPDLVETIVEDDVWIGHGAIVLQGVRIGEGSIVAAGSVVTKNVEPYTIVAGNPATKIRDRFRSDEIARHREGMVRNGFL